MILKKLILITVISVNLAACNSLQVSDNKYVKAFMERIDIRQGESSKTLEGNDEDLLYIPNTDRKMLGSEEVVTSVNGGAKLKPIAASLTSKSSLIEVVKKAQVNHFDPIKLNDEQSKNILRKYLSVLDHKREVFLESDIREFLLHKNTLDDQLVLGQVDTAYLIFNRYRDRRFERNQYILHLINTQLNTLLQNSKEQLPYKAANIWQINGAGLQLLWLQQLQYEVLLLRMQNQSPKNIKKILIKRYLHERQFLAKLASDDVFTMYVNAVLDAFDIHSHYISPAHVDYDVSEIDELGVVASYRYGSLYIEKTIAGGPAQHLLSAGDSIIAIGASMENMLETSGSRLEKLYQAINRLSQKSRYLFVDIKRFNAPYYIERVKLPIEKTEYLTARSSRIKMSNKRSTKEYIGVIHIPSFYVDITSKNHQDYGFKRVSQDVEQLIIKLMKDGVDGIVFDLRGNSGGSLHEVSKIIGLLIEEGATLQVKSKRGVQILQDDIPSRLYTGPVAALVDSHTGSAAEVFAAAIQDYRLGLVIGSRTYGHGTISSNITLSNDAMLTLTQAKTYRTSGEGIQQQGVVPDIAFSSVYPEKNDLLLGRTLDYDQINTAELYSPLPLLKTDIIAKLKLRHQEREQEHSKQRLNTLLQRYARVSHGVDTLSLDMTTRKNEIIEHTKLIEHVVPLMKQFGKHDEYVKEAAYILYDFKQLHYN